MRAFTSVSTARNVDRPEHGFANAGANYDRAMAAHQHDRMLAERGGQGAAKLAVADEHVGRGPAGVADFEHRGAGTQEAAHMIDRLQGRSAHAEGDHGG